MTPRQWRAAAGVWAIPAMLIGVITACDPVFEPFEDRGREFSIFGFFDAAADTQWVRVTPIRESILGSPESSEVRVTLEDLSNGNVIELENQVLRFDGSFFLEDGEDLYVQNFRTTLPIEPGGTYQFTASRADGATATTVLHIPEDYVVAVEYPLVPYPRNGPATVRAVGIDYSGPVYTHCENPQGPPTTLNRFFETVTVGDRAYETTGVAARGDCEDLRRKIIVVASGSRWPSGLAFATSALAVPDLPLNVDNAVGFLVGVHSQSWIFSPCWLEPHEGPCGLTYDPESVTVSGTVLDDTCGGPVPPNGVVQLREIRPEPGAASRLREVRTNRDGLFILEALEPGLAHHVRITHPARWPPDDPFSTVKVYEDYEGIVEAFESGERASLGDIPLHRRVGCEAHPEGSDGGP